MQERSGREKASVDLSRHEAYQIRLHAVQLLRFVVKSQPRRKTRRILRAAALMGTDPQIRTASASFRTELLSIPRRLTAFKSSQLSRLPQAPPASFFLYENARQLGHPPSVDVFAG
jgi:hypothetical protein